MRTKSNLKPHVLYGISGRKGHGKDTFARLVCESSAALKVSRGLESESTFLVTHFAKALKDMSIKVFGLTLAQVNDQTLKEDLLGIPIQMDLLLDAMRYETGLRAIQPAARIARTPREVLQFFGTEYVRKTQGDYWVQRLLNDVRGHRQCLVPDTRFPNEALALRSVGGQIIKVLRVDAPPPQDEHPSETEIDKIEPDLLIGVRTGDLSLPKRVATLIAAGKFGAAQKYDYRTAQLAISSYLGGCSLETAAKHLGDARQKDPYVLRNLLDYYGGSVRHRGGGRMSRVPHKVIAGTPHKWCSKCSAWKALFEFNEASKAWDGLGGLCRPCAAESNKARYLNYGRELNSLGAVFEVFRRAAPRRGLSFSLTFEDVQAIWDQQRGLCYYSGVAMNLNRGSSDKVSLDRLDSTLGYTSGNVVLCTARVNLMKRDLTVSDFSEAVRAIYGHLVAQKKPNS